MGAVVASETRSAAPETRSTKGAATRDQILNAAARLIHIQGYQSTSLDDVLRESGVGKGNFYYYFKSKEDRAYWAISRITQRSVERGPHLASAPAQVDEGFRPRLAGVFDRRRIALAAAVTRGQARGPLRADMAACRVAQFLVAALEGAILLSKVNNDITVMATCVEELKR